MEYDRVERYLRTEPRLAALQAHIEALLSLVEFESAGEPVKIDGFRIRNLIHWLGKVPPSALSSLGPLSADCNCSCQFCYLKGNPILPNQPWQTAHQFPSLEEIAIRLQVFDQESTRGMPVPEGLDREVFCHPRVLEVLKLVRHYSPTETIFLVTNGSHLDSDTVLQLKVLQPIRLMVSVNSMDHRSRARIMNDRHSARTLEGISLLAKHKVPFIASIVATPDQDEGDLRGTLAALELLKPMAMKVNLPSFTRYNMPPGYNWRSHWSAIRRLVSSGRRELETPVYLQPNTETGDHLQARVIGVIKNSPAHKQGILPGDLLTRVDGVRVSSSQHAKDLLASRNDTVNLIIWRGRAQSHIELRYEPPSEDHYPYTVLDRGFSYGLVLPSGIRLSSVKRLRLMLREEPSAKSLFIASRLGIPLLRRIMRSTPFFLNTNFEVAVPRSQFFGGNIMAGDMLTVSDIEAEIVGRLKSGAQIDSVIIPATMFSEWGYDLEGRHYRELEESCHVRVQLLLCEPVTAI